jgi:hypothetical protein
MRVHRFLGKPVVSQIRSRPQCDRVMPHDPRALSMNVKIAILVAPSEYERLTLDVASSSPMECLLGRVLSRSLFAITNENAGSAVRARIAGVSTSRTTTDSAKSGVTTSTAPESPLVSASCRRRRMSPGGNRFDRATQVRHPREVPGRDWLESATGVREAVIEHWIMSYSRGCAEACESQKSAPLETRSVRQS